MAVCRRVVRDRRRGTGHDCRRCGPRPDRAARRLGSYRCNPAGPRHIASAEGWLDADRRAARRAFRTSRHDAGRDAGAATNVSGRAMVDRPAAGRLAAARVAAESVPDPELPAVTIADLGILRDVALREDGTAEVTITPTYNGCPVMMVIALDIERAMEAAGFPDAVVRTVLAPAWT